jgi:hypothetical protein
MRSISGTAHFRTLAAVFSRFVFVLGALGGGDIASGDELAELRAKAEKGDAVAQYDLAQRYASGTGIAKDEAAALEWYLKSAARDHVPAFVSLGSVYAHGFGVKQDWAESIRWYRKAALAGNRIAQHNLGLDYEHGHGVPQDYVTAGHWYWLGAEQGQPRCQYNLGQLWETGKGRPVNESRAFFFYSLATAHENQNHIFGEAKAKELADKRDAIASRLSPATIEAIKSGVAYHQAFVAVNPRQFGPADSKIGTSRGWYIWKSFNPETREVEVMPDDPHGKGNVEVFKAKMLPWATTYRHLTYGAGPEGLLPGERVNIFFNPDENHRRGYLVHFQDEICQMKGHYHAWKIEQFDDAGFSARVYYGDKPSGEPAREFTFDPKCRYWSQGKQVEKSPAKVGDRVLMTWCVEGAKNVVKLLTDDASLEAIKAIETERLTKKIAAEGLMGRVESLDGDQAHFMVYGEHWLQAQQLKEGTKVRVSAADPYLKLTGPTTDAVVSFRKNRGTYGSGVTDLLLKITNATDAEKLRGVMLRSSTARIIRVEP